MLAGAPHPDARDGTQHDPGAWREATRCLGCYDAPCNRGCPAGIDVKGFIGALARGDVALARMLIEKENPLAAVCGWVCPQEVLCQRDCTARRLGSPIDIRRLHRFAVEEGRRQLAHIRMPAGALAGEQATHPRGNPVAIIGAGPAGLAAAHYLARYGYRPVVFESASQPGGKMGHGIPPYRLPAEVLQQDLERILDGSFVVKPNAVLGAPPAGAGSALTVADLNRQGFEAVFVAAGRNRPVTLSIPGVELPGVITGDEVQRLEQVPARAAVVGGGNAAMDAARTLARRGALVYLIYRRSPLEMPAWSEERENAWGDGVVFELLADPVEIQGEKRVEALRCRRMQPSLNRVDAGGRRPVQELSGYEFTLPVELVVQALGHRVDPTWREILPGVAFDDAGFIVVDPGTLATSCPGIFAGGDVVVEGRHSVTRTQPAVEGVRATPAHSRGTVVHSRGTVVQAVADGKRAARAIHAYLSNPDRVRWSGSCEDPCGCEEGVRHNGPGH